MSYFQVDSFYYAQAQHDLECLSNALEDNASRNITFSKEDKKKLRRVVMQLKKAALELEEVLPLIEKGDYGELN